MDEKNYNFIKKYYEDPKIREMITEQSKQYDYAIGTGQILLERGWTFPVKEVPVDRLGELLNDGLDIFFPLRTKNEKYFYILWDIEYFNTVNRKFIFTRKNQREVFKWMAEPLYIVEDILNSFKIKYVIDTTMSGIHVWSKVSTSSLAFRELTKIGTVLSTLEEKYSAVVANDRKRSRPMPPDLGKAYNASGKILEYFTHILIKKNENRKTKYKIPITISDTPQFKKGHQFSGLSSDLTQYAHPVYMRCMRALGSIHQKSIINGFPEMGPAIDIVKRPGMPYSKVLDIMWDADKAIKYYKENFPGKYIEVPDASAGWLNAVRAYNKSGLKAKHRQWEHANPAPENPVSKYPCFAGRFDAVSANPQLLIPSNLQLIAEFFGKHYGVSCAKNVFNSIARDFYMNEKLGWYDPARYTGIDWCKYDAYTATDFWGRTYWSMWAMGLGRGADCATIKKVGICPKTGSKLCEE